MSLKFNMITKETIDHHTQLLIDKYNIDSKFEIDTDMGYIEYTDKDIGIVAYLSGDIDKNQSTYYISYVEVHPKFRGLGLCSILIDLMIINTQLKKYILMNEGGVSACKCYNNTFRKNNYKNSMCDSCDGLKCPINREMKFQIQI